MGQELRLIPMKEVVYLTSLSKSEIERRIEANRFPHPVRLSQHARGRKAFWFHEIQDFLRGLGRLPT